MYFVHIALMMLNVVISKDIPISCTTKDGPYVSGIGKISQVSCDVTQTLVSCGIYGWQNIGGTWIENGVCNALSNYDQRGIKAKARCCTFPNDAVKSTSITSSVNGESVYSVCPSDAVLTGCNVYYKSGGYGTIKGSFSGPNIYPLQTDSWMSTNNQCNAQSYSKGTVIAGATCLQLNNGYNLECKTKVKYTNYANFGVCEDGYSMMSCNTLSNGLTLDSYYVDSNNRCAIQQDNWAKMYGNAICCKLTTHSNVTDDDVTDNSAIIDDAADDTPHHHYHHHHHRHGHHKEIIWIIIGLSVGFIFMTLCCCYFYCRYNKMKKQLVNATKFSIIEQREEDGDDKQTSEGKETITVR